MVSIKRIDAFLEDETIVVEGSTDYAVGTTRDEVLSITDGTFQWAPLGSPTENPVSAGADGAPSGNITIRTSFQLRDISVVFPPRKLTLVTGPTASGKTALLVSPVFNLSVPSSHHFDSSWHSSAR